MARAKTLTILIILTAAMVAGGYLTQQGSDTIPMSGKPLVAGLLTDLNRVAIIRVTGRGETFVIQQKEGRWVVPERSDYIASAQLVQQLLVGLAETVRIEPKTSKPELYAKIGLGDPAAADEHSGMVRFELEDNNDKVLTSVVIGQQQEARGGPNLNEYYVLKDDDPQVWLVQGNLPTENEVGDWVDNEVMGIEPQRVARVTVAHPTGETVVVTRSRPEDSDFTLVDQPEGTEIVQKWQVDDIGRGVARLQFQDVTKAALDGMEAAPGIVVTMETHDGMRVVMTTVTKPRPKAQDGTSSGDAPYLYASLAASFDEALVNQALLDEKKAGAGKDTETLERDARLAAEAVAKLSSPDDVKKEVETLNPRWAGWVYELQDFKARHLLRTMAELVKPREESTDQNAGEGPVQGPVQGPQPVPPPGQTNAQSVPETKSEKALPDN